MSLRDVIGNTRDTVLRLLPHRAPTGLVRIGDPDRDSPVLLTGNYTMSVRRVRRSLRGLDAWLLVANSRGVNVWCAAGGGHLTHHDVISVLRTSGIADRSVQVITGVGGSRAGSCRRPPGSPPPAST